MADDTLHRFVGIARAADGFIAARWKEGATGPTRGTGIGLLASTEAARRLPSTLGTIAPLNVTHGR